MNPCLRYAPELLEAARHAVQPAPDARRHLDQCPACAAAFERQQRLSAHLRALAQSAAPQRSSPQRQALLLRTFTARRNASRWRQSLAAAAVFLIGLAVFANLWHAPRQTLAPSAVTQDAAEGFTPLPYTPPLASGEFVHIVHADLPASGATRLGIDVDPADESPVPVDVLLGQDDMPRAVRVSPEDFTAQK